MPVALPSSIPSPEQAEIQLGPLPIRAYALAIIIGIVVAIWLGTRRWAARGGVPEAVVDIAIWAVPFGIVGARIYHVVTDYQLYFSEGRDPMRAFEIWQGGLGIWGAIAGGALGAWIACRRRNIPLPAMADALAPGILIAQGIGRWGNYFNNELYGRQTDLPWGLEVHQMENGRAVRGPDGEPVLLDGLYHPTFLYESLWAFAVAGLLIWADRRFRLGHGRVFALYVAGYTLGRSLFEYLRIDEANEILGLRVNQWVSALLFVAAVVYVIWSARTRPGRETPEELRGTYAEPGDVAETSDDAEKPEGAAPGGTSTEDESTPTSSGDESSTTRAGDESGDADDVAVPQRTEAGGESGSSDAEDTPGSEK
ncbi:prolipoprotein diacylglyceryl transferase [Phytoactinopolyspora sp. XMNu-373]|uniref:Phosphatidylglycerol--prolipoprotein diacylglyceryl transferase n=1 Tax=Phytoactinopolyspora mesophila TaxID=2650750 RepID=A0A7K3LZ28_9ACTN|nr:prolipoprotein diacylglyceryl transferase [Phytoactinopolyspora mesophila]NDL55468.1 prolipoprotein diacylglyceryl transferase [Phytoactinopolyspora mesophila]